MRDVKRSEIVLYKCPTCGSKNKIYTILEDKCGNRIGSTLKCCNCGTLLKRLDDLDATIKDENGNSYPGKQYCIKLHYCKNCATCPLKVKKEDNTDNKCDCNCNNCPRRYCCIKNQNCGKLTIKVNKVYNFR